MKVININTGELIEELKGIPGHVFWATPEYWAEYKEWCKLMTKRQNDLFYGRR